MSCTTNSVYDSVEQCPGAKVLPGIRRRLYYIPKADIANWPTLPNIGSTGVNMGDLAKYTGDFTLAAEKYFKSIDLKDEASNATVETVGENGSKLHNNQASFIVAGISDEIKGFLRQAINEDIIFVAQQRDGKFVVFGNEMFECHVNGSADTGAEATAAVTATIAVQVYDECAIPTYEGKLALSATQYMDCADGTIKPVQV